MRWSDGITKSINGHEFEQIPGDEGHGSLVCCSPWGQKDFEYNLATDQQPRPKKTLSIQTMGTEQDCIAHPVEQRNIPHTSALK